MRGRGYGRQWQRHCGLPRDAGGDGLRDVRTGRLARRSLQYFVHAMESEAVPQHQGVMIMFQQQFGLRAAVCFAYAASAANLVLAGAPVRTVMLTGQQAPSTAAGVLIDEPSFPYVNFAGQSVISATLVGAGVTAGNNLGLWSEGGGALA